MATRKNSKIWVRQSNFAGSLIGAVADTARVQSLRDTSTVTTAGGTSLVGLDAEFTVVRFIGHWYVEYLESSASLVTNPASLIFGARVAGTEEIEELTADANYRAEAGPSADPMADWHTWVPCYPGNGGLVQGTNEVFFARGMFDIRSARRIDGLREDFGVFAQWNAAAAGATQSFRLSYAALCIVH